jgi:2'-5' RNA ligase
VDDRGRSRRLFVGIELDDAARGACAAVAQRLRGTGFDAKYESPEKLHVTLAFLGSVGANQNEAIAAALDRVATENEPFGLTLDRVGAFPHERRPRVIYVGARDQGVPFRKLAQSTREAYAALGFAFDEDPVAHVTIARVKDPRAPLRSVEFSPISFQVNTLSLFESLFDPKGNTSRYEVSRVAPLSAV